MTQEEKTLLLQDLCARLPYAVIAHASEINKNGIITDVNISYNMVNLTVDNTNGRYELVPLFDIKPYLRPMSSMTEEEKRELQSFYPGSFGGQWLDTEKGTIEIFECNSTITLYLNDSQRIVDGLNKNMFDYRGLIEKGLANEAPEGMYN